MIINAFLFQLVNINFTSKVVAIVSYTTFEGLTLSSEVEFWIKDDWLC